MNTCGRCDWCGEWASDHRRNVVTSYYNAWFCPTCFYGYLIKPEEYTDRCNKLVSCANLDCKELLLLTASSCPVLWGETMICILPRRKTAADYHDLAKSRGINWIEKRIPTNTRTAKTKWKCDCGHIW